MALEDTLGQQSLVLDLLAAANIAPKVKAAYEETLTAPEVAKLIATLDLEPVKQKLKGKRVTITGPQQELVTIVRYLRDFDRCVEAWLKTDTEPYAVEHVLAHFDIPKRKFTDHGTTEALVEKLGFADLQTLRKYSRFVKELAELYGKPLKGEMDYAQNASKVAKRLIGRTLEVPNSSLGSALTINAWQAFRRGENQKYQPTLAQIIETEGFETEDQVTKSRYCMLAAPGQIDLMPNRGHKLLNIGTQKTDVPSCVMIRSVLIDGNVVEGPGRVGEALFAESLVGQFLGKDITMTGLTAPSGYIPGTAAFSVGRYRMQ